MFRKIDAILNNMTMYRLVLYYLHGIIAIALVFGFFGVVPYEPIMIVYSALFFFTVCWIGNKIFSWAFNAPTNIESFFITALIFVLIITPPKSFIDIRFFSIALWASLWSMASKYILAIRNKHIFNPAAFAVALTAITINQSASWWVGTAVLMPFVLVGGFLIVRKIRRFDLVINGFIVAVVTIVSVSALRGTPVLVTIQKTLRDTPLFFFLFVMLTEPLTTPPTRRLRIIYGIITGFLFAPWIHIGAVFSTPELALIAGNIFSFSVSPKEKLMLILKKKIRVAEGIYDFIFIPGKRLLFKPGQYLEWTLAHPGADNRGNRRFFTIASSPSEEEVRMGVRFYEKPSSFKKKLGALNPGDRIVAGQLAGDFILPKNPERKLVFIAGGIGVTPFRSMIKYLLDHNERRDIALFYSSKSVADFAYTEVFDEAEKRLGIKTIYTVTDQSTLPPEWKGEIGYIDRNMIRKYVTGFWERIFYLSGPRSMIDAFEAVLKNMGIPASQIKKDYFPGFA